MGPDQVIDLFRTALYNVIFMVSAIILPGLVIGLIISVFQAATQINEQTLSFIPRLIVTMLSLIFFGPWLLKIIVAFTESLITNVAQYVG